ncbi:amino acid ABC transporter permease [Roseateles sp. BYS78W]|uniref:Amino acid ABC transporter permease n=1 Tax=Pelomonas candidula TaxID=3299025 RepID=A0ABW7HK33_9BURK
MSWDWQFYCNDTATGEAVAGCFGPGGKEQTYLQWMLSAWGWTLTISLLALVLALIVGSMIGIIRTAPNKWLARFGEAWTELFRNIPLLVQVFLWYHVLPALFPSLRDAVPPSVLVICALGFFTSARIGEQVKAGINTLPRGQRYAGQAMGMTLPQTYRYVLLPMAYRIVIPPLTSESMNLVKNSAVAFAVSIPDMSQFVQQASEETAHFYEIYIPITLLYFLSAFLLNRVAKFIEARVRIPGTVGAK